VNGMFSRYTWSFGGRTASPAFQAPPPRPLWLQLWLRGASAQAAAAGGGVGDAGPGL